MPRALLPDIEAEPLHVQISTIWRAYVCYTYRDPSREDDSALVERYRAITRLYAELGEAGYHIKSAHGLKERHAKVLLQLWRDQGKKASTIRSRWSILRMWMLALGRAGAVGPVEQYWPAIPAPEQKGAGKGENLHDKTVSEAQMTELMRASDPTHWYVERLHQELGVTVQEALSFDSHMATKALTGRLVLSSSGDGFRTVSASAQSQVSLVQEIEAFIAMRGRQRLMWSDMPLAAALKRHQNRLAYLRRKLPADPACAYADAETVGESRASDRSQRTGGAQ